MSDFGPACLDCGHPADIHTTTRCEHVVINTSAACDCPGYHHPDRPAGDGRPNHAAPSHTAGSFDEAGYSLAGDGRLYAAPFGFRQS